MSAGVIDKERRLGRYVLKRPLGEGGNGQVFLAWQDNASGEPLPCVVKFPLQRYATSEESRQRCLQEARLAMRLGAHVNIVQVIDVDEYERMPFIVMQYIDGVDLQMMLNHTRKRRRGLSLASIYNILAGAASGLRHAHIVATIDGKAVRVVHRDIKPANLLITRDGTTKIADFGIGGTVEEGTTGQHWRGTARYMSPEHLRCELRPEMDIYALGVTAWEMTENRVYREDCRGTQHYERIMDGDVPPMRNRDTPTQLASIIEACLDTNLRHRPTASELLKALARCPGYSRDPDDVAHELGSLIGTRRTSGATQQQLAATPELIATFAVLEQQAQPKPQSTDDLVLPTVVQRRPSANLDQVDPASPQAASDVVEPDAPRFFRRRVASVTPTAELSLDIGAPELGSTPDAGADAKTIPIDRPAAEPNEPAALGVATPGPATAAPASRLVTSRRLLVVGGSALAALLVVGWLGVFDDAPAVPAVSATTVPTESSTSEETTAQAGAPAAPTVVDSTVPAAEPPRPSQVEPSAKILERVESPSVTSEQPPPSASVPRAAPGSKVPPPTTLPIRVVVTLTLFLVEAAEVKIGRKTIEVHGRLDTKIIAGTHRVKWRLAGESGWHDAGRVTFAEGHHYFVRVHSSSDPEIIDIDRRAK